MRCQDGRKNRMRKAGRARGKASVVMYKKIEKATGRYNKKTKRYKEPKIEVPIERA